MTENNGDIANGDTFQTAHPESPAIWTRPFAIVFSLILIIGGSLASLLTQYWGDGYIALVTILFSYMGLIGLSWLVLLLIAHNAWIRTGALLGCLWSIITTWNDWLSAHAFGLSTVITDINVANNCIFLAMLTCLSVGLVPFQRWDQYLFRVLTFIIIIPPLLTLAITHTIAGLEHSLATTALLLSLAIWWLRPILWQKQPLPGCLFGLAICLQFTLAIPAVVEQNTFVLQIIRLCILLGSVRILQAELRLQNPLDSDQNVFLWIKARFQRTQA